PAQVHGGDVRLDRAIEIAAHHFRFGQVVHGFDALLSSIGQERAAPAFPVRPRFAYSPAFSSASACSGWRSRYQLSPEKNSCSWPRPCSRARLAAGPSMRVIMAAVLLSVWMNMSLWWRMTAAPSGSRLSWWRRTTTALTGTSGNRGPGRTL